MSRAAVFGWMRLAACQSADLSLFFGPDGETPPETAVREARATVICATCPVRLRCLETAFKTPAQHGVRGGMGEAERTRARRLWLRSRAAQARKAAVA